MDRRLRSSEWCATSWALEHGFLPDEVVRRGHGRPSLATIIEFLPSGDHEAESRSRASGNRGRCGCSRASGRFATSANNPPPSAGARRYLRERSGWPKRRLRAAGLPVPASGSRRTASSAASPSPTRMKGRGGSWDRSGRLCCCGGCRVRCPLGQSGSARAYSHSAHYVERGRAFKCRSGLDRRKFERAFS